MQPMNAEKVLAGLAEWKRIDERIDLEIEQLYASRRLQRAVIFFVCVLVLLGLTVC